MIALIATLALAAPVGLDRVDLVSEDNPTWLVDDLPRVGDTPRATAVRFVEQVEPVWFTPIDGLTVGTSVRTQSLQWERPASPALGVYGSMALLTRLGLPSGARIGAALRRGPVRIGASLTLLSSASWSRPDWSVWRPLPALGVGVGRSYDEPSRAPWMD